MGNLFVNRIKLNRENIDETKYPFNIKWLSSFDELKIDNAVTMFYGENGAIKEIEEAIDRLPIANIDKEKIYNKNFLKLLK